MFLTIGVVLYPGCIFFEVALAIELVSKKYQIVVLTPDGGNFTASNGLTFGQTQKFSDFDSLSCAGLLIPGGDPQSLVGNTEIQSLIQRMNADKRVIAAICAGPSIVAAAGVLKGRKSAHGYGPPQLEFLKDLFAGVQLSDDAWVRDGHFITAKPSSHIDFAVELARELDVVTAEQAAKLKRYYRGAI